MSQYQTRKWTRLLVDAVDQGMIDPKSVFTMCMSYMSEDAVKDMCRANDIMSIDPTYSDDDEDDKHKELL